MSLISDRISKNIKPSPTLLAQAKANELKSKGFPIISLATGEPDFDTPINIKEAAIKAMNDGYTKYTPSGGFKETKEAIIRKFKRENNLQYELKEVCVNSGAKQTIYNAMMATLNPKDEVIIISPFWVSYPEIVKISGGTPVIVNTDPDNGFKLDTDIIEQAITADTKWIIINSPNNPSGLVYGQEELKNLANMLLKYPHVHILSDDIYEHLIYDNLKFYNIAEIEPKLKNRTLTVNGLSKSYAMTGWRIGYCGGPAELIEAMSTIQSQSTSCPSSISQIATIEALDGNQNHIKENNEIYLKRRNLTAKLINQIPDLKCNIPNGAFYLFVDCRALFGKKTPDGKTLNNSIDVVDYLLEKSFVATVAGSPFGAEGFFRISYAIEEEKLEEACKRIGEACKILLA